jgi:hypothetical protein
MKGESVKDYADAVRGRYKGGGRKAKGEVLDEFVRVTGYHRKTAIRLLGGKRKEPGGRRGRRRQYGVEVGAALKHLWEAADRVCSRRLQPFLPELIEVMTRRGRVALSGELSEQLLRMSASTIDRLLRPYRGRERRRGFSTTRASSLLKRQIPVRTFADWDEACPGFLEVDLVAHCGESTEGFYLNTLMAVDIHTEWVEFEPVWGKREEKVRGAVHQVRKRLPFVCKGLDSDNGSEFINRELQAYCAAQKITFTRSRPYKKNDSAHVEQKNWSVVRRLLGYDRYSSREAFEQMQRVYALLRLYTNFLQPTMKLICKTRDGAKVHKVYDRARTPYRRLLESPDLPAETRESLAQLYAELDPVSLLAQINRALEELWDLADHRQRRDRSVTPILTQEVHLR